MKRFFVLCIGTISVVSFSFTYSQSIPVNQVNSQMLTTREINALKQEALMSNGLSNGSNEAYDLFQSLRASKNKQDGKTLANYILRALEKENAFMEFKDKKIKLIELANIYQENDGGLVGEVYVYVFKAKPTSHPVFGGKYDFGIDNDLYKKFIRLPASDLATQDFAKRLVEMQNQKADKLEKEANRLKIEANKIRAKVNINKMQERELKILFPIPKDLPPPTPLPLDTGKKIPLPTPY